MAHKNYRRSIWEHQSVYDFDPAEITAKNLETIARLVSVDAAKKRTQPAPAMGLLKISRAAESMPEVGVAKVDDLVSYLKIAANVHGVGIPTAICMLAVATVGRSGGNFPPMDRKIAAGLHRGGVVGPSEKQDLVCTTKNETAFRSFATVYIEKVVPFWNAVRAVKCSREADEIIASLRNARESRRYQRKKT